MNSEDLRKVLRQGRHPPRLVVAVSGAAAVIAVSTSGGAPLWVITLAALLTLGLGWWVAPLIVRLSTPPLFYVMAVIFITLFVISSQWIFAVMAVLNVGNALLCLWIDRK